MPLRCVATYTSLNRGKRVVFLWFLFPLNYFNRVKRQNELCATFTLKTDVFRIDEWYSNGVECFNVFSFHNNRLRLRCFYFFQCFEINTGLFKNVIGKVL